jgi:hypothetical protein
MSTPAAPGSPAPVSRGAAWKIVLSVVAITGAVGFLLRASVKEGACTASRSRRAP